MVRLTSLFARALPVAAFAVAAPAASTPQLRRQVAGGEACAEIGRVYDEAIITNTTDDVVVKPSLAYQCLRSISVDVERDTALVRYLRPWLEYQSTVDILLDPPAEYLYLGVDIFGGLDNITQSLENGGYESQIDFTVDLYRLINVKPRDGHLSWSPVLGVLISFSTPALFISISEDGIKSPRIYLYSDYQKSTEQGYNASEVKSFDTAPIVDYIQQRSVDNSRDQDPDAAYNEQLYSAALENVLETTSAGRHLHTTLNDESVIEFANGTEVIVVNRARIVANFSGITSGQAIHERFEVPLDNGEAEVTLNTTRIPFSPALKGYPEPSVIHEDRYISGYFFNDSTLGDTAVLAVNVFMSQNGTARTVLEALEDPIEFARVASEFVNRSKSQNKTKLIVDLQGNGGGLVANAMSLYATLFPEAGAEAHMNMRVRAHAALNWVGRTAERLGADLKTLPYPVGFNGFVDEDLRNFTSWGDFYGPETIEGSNYTNVVQPLEVAYARTGLPGIFEIPEPWFKPGDTVILTDGHCASACAYIVGMMTRELGIQVVAMGGRPIDAPMQAVGGSKGGPVISLGPYQTIYPALGAFAKPPEGIDMTPFADPNPPLAGLPTDTWTVNSANIYLDDDLNGVPMQFIYEAANCKLYYTWETLTNMTSLWTAVAMVKWNGAKCVPGSTTNDDYTIGSVPGYTNKVVSSFKWAAGPGDVDGASGSANGDSGNGGNNESNSGDDDENAAGSLRASWKVLALVLSISTMLFFL
ncbi:peptidase S41 family protein [Colletotrichum paranaense]|uniref:Peptidase S41 family protein n=1 Tax=Colletotrichum paranaense TaxID=1914294 RepID=A0ABQ9S513_9PEZI|nr:peptidase S41 family protein [Colletotrichum paranaense]KAK1524624.1 peptidase S41 family protein [Colletotrichum paranaense]